MPLGPRSERRSLLAVYGCCWTEVWEVCRLKKLLFGIVLSLGIWFPRHATDVLAFHAPPGVLTRVLPGMAQYHLGDRVISKIVSIRRITVQGKKPCTGCILPGDGSGGGTLTLF